MPRNRPILLLAVGHACVDVYQGAVAALVPFFIAERSYTYVAASGIVLAASLLSSLAQPVFGVLTDRRAMPWLLTAGTVVGGVGIAMSGIGQSYPLTLVFVAVSGLGIAAYHPESARAARLASAGSHRAMGRFALGGNIGFATAPLLVGLVVGVGGLGLTPLLALPALVGASLTLPVVRALGGSTPPRLAVGGSGTDDWASFVRLALVVACRSVVFVGISTFIAVHAARQTGWGTTGGTAALCVLYLGGGVGTILGGRLAHRWRRVTVVAASYGVSVLAVAGVVFVPGPGIYLAVALVAIGLYVPFSLQVTLAQDFLPNRMGTASGITLGLMVSVGGSAVPIIGALADATSLRTAMIPLIVIPALCFLLVRRLPEPVGVDGASSRTAGTTTSSGSTALG